MYCEHKNGTGDVCPGSGKKSRLYLFIAGPTFSICSHGLVLVSSIPASFTVYLTIFVVTEISFQLICTIFYSAHFWRITGRRQTPNNYGIWSVRIIKLCDTPIPDSLRQSEVMVSCTLDPLLAGRLTRSPSIRLIRRSTRRRRSCTCTHRQFSRRRTSTG